MVLARHRLIAVAGAAMLSAAGCAEGGAPTVTSHPTASPRVSSSVERPGPARTPSVAPQPAVQQQVTKPKPRPEPNPVPGAAPTAFRYAGKGYRIAANVCGMAFVVPLDPPGEQHDTVCWVEHDFGHAPGTDGAGTTYILGHSWAEDPLEVLNPLSEPATAQALRNRSAGRIERQNGVVTYPIRALDGDTVTLQTKHGTLHYTVRDAYAVAKAHAGYVHSLMAQDTKRRVVIITCAENHGVDYHYDIIVEAYLRSAERAPTQ